MEIDLSCIKFKREDGKLSNWTYGLVFTDSEINHEDFMRGNCYSTVGLSPGYNEYKTLSLAQMEAPVTDNIYIASVFGE